MKILLVAGGSPELWPQFESTDYDLFVGIDRGTWHLLNRGITPDFAVGDFDSLSEAEREKVFATIPDVLSSIPEKDDTDTQLALAETFKRYPTADVCLIGATGGRLDHLLANLWLGVEPRFVPHLAQLTLQDRQNVVTYLAPGSYTIEKIPTMKYLGYCCLTPVTDLTLSKSKYTLDHVQVVRPTSWASNEFVGSTAEISFSTGIIAVVQSKDQA